MGCGGVGVGVGVGNGVGNGVVGGGEWGGGGGSILYICHSITFLMIFKGTYRVLDPECPALPW